MHEEQVLRMALACIRWNQFGECRTDGWPGLPPTAADTVAALEASLAKPQPVGGALTEELKDQIADFAMNHRDADVRAFACEVHDALATLSAPAAQPGEDLRELLREARDNAIASTAEEDISADRRAYRRELAERLNAARNALAAPAQAAQPAAAAPVAWGIRRKGAKEPHMITFDRKVAEHDMRAHAERAMLTESENVFEFVPLFDHAAPAQAAAVPEAVERDAAPELLAMLKEATDALAGGLWDYGPGQDEHEKCNEVIEKCRAAIARAGGQGDVSGEGEGS